MTYIRTFQPFPCQNNEFIDILFTKDVVVPYNETLYAIDTLFISVKLKKCLPLQAIYFLKTFMNKYLVSCTIALTILVSACQKESGQDGAAYKAKAKSLIKVN